MRSQRPPAVKGRGRRRSSQSRRSELQHRAWHQCTLHLGERHEEPVRFLRVPRLFTEDQKEVSLASLVGQARSSQHCEFKWYRKSVTIYVHKEQDTSTVDVITDRIQSQCIIYRLKNLNLFMFHIVPLRSVMRHLGTPMETGSKLKLQNS